MQSNTTLTPEQATFIRRASLVHSINQAFRDASAMVLRQWYVRTFVMDPFNLSVLTELDNVPIRLQELGEDMTWPTIEHAAIGMRLLWAINPELVAPFPDVLVPEKWKNEFDIARTVLHVATPWQSIRYDPEGENWYKAVSPGQWQRHGKGAPSSDLIESWLMRWFDKMTDISLYNPWPMQGLDKYGTDDAASRIVRSMNFMATFTRQSMSLSRVRKILETMAIMHLDTSTLNQVRQVTPFSNGALCLVTDVFTDTTGAQHVNNPGDLLSMDLDYMVTNANSLPWNDIRGAISSGMFRVNATDGEDWDYLDSYEDELMLQVPTYWSFLTHAFPEADERSAFLRLLGAAMFGNNIKIVAAMIGEPNAGKDTVINWLNYVMPGQVATLPFSAFTPHGDEDRGFAPLRGARVATVSGEIGEGRGSKLLAEKIKTVSSGGGKIRVAEKYEKPTDVFFDGMLFLQGNSVPTIQGGDKALYTNRIVAVEFKHPFPLQARSYDADYRAEAPAFIQILFINYLRYEYRGGGMVGVNPPETWRAFAKEFADSSNPHGFLETCIVKSGKPIPVSQFHSALSAMVSKFGSPYPVGANFWPRRIRSLGFETKGPTSVKKQVMENGHREWCYYLTVDAGLSDGMFNQTHWSSVLKDAAVTS